MAERGESPPPQDDQTPTAAGAGHDPVPAAGEDPPGHDARPSASPPPRRPGPGVSPPAPLPPPPPLKTGEPAGPVAVSPPPWEAKASTAVKLGTLGVLSALVLAFCAAAQDNDDERYDEVGADCVDTSTQLPDGSYAVVDDEYCDDEGGSTYHGSHGAYRWYYGGSRVNGGRVMYGTTVRPPDVGISTRSGRVIQRGGFGFHSGGGG